jgi:predicted permease
MIKSPLDGLDDDIRDHIERETQDNIDRGMLPVDARAAAIRKFGNIARIKEDTRAVWVPIWFDQLSQDLRYAARTMRRQPGFTVAAVAMLAIGLGLVAGGYTVFNGFFVRGWNLPDNDQLFTVQANRLQTPAGAFVNDGITEGAYAHIRQHAQSATYVAMMIDYFRVSGDPAAFGTHTAGMILSSNAVETLGIPLQLGTGFGGVESPANPRIVISDGLWRRLFGADPSVVGRTVWLNKVPATVVGITARGFDGLGPRPLDVILDSGAAAPWRRERQKELAADGTRCCVMLSGRLQPTRSRSQAQHELLQLTSQYRSERGQPPLAVLLTSTAAFDGLRGSGRENGIRVVLALIGAGLLLVMLLTCANVGNLYLARSLRRQREIAIRLSLGAGRARIVRQLLTEGLLLASIAGSIAFLMTWGVPFALQQIEDNATVTMFAADWRVAVFTALAVVASCLLVSLAPALQTTRISWRGATPMMSPRTGPARGIVLAAQITIAAVLVVTATLLARGILHATSAETDFALHRTTAVHLQSRSNAAHTRTRIDHIRAALNRAAADSSLQIGIAGAVPISSGRPGLQSSVQPAGSEAKFRCRLLPLTEAGAGVLQLRLRSGRWASDDPHAAEAVINETLARQIWQDGSAVGRSLTLSYDDRAYTIVGVVRDSHLTSLSEIEPIIHITDTNSLPVLLARTAPGVEARIKALVGEIDPSIELTFAPLSKSVKESLENALIGVTIAGGLAVIALILAIVGVFGVFSYLVEERRQEIGIRLALGATRIQIGRALLTAVRGAMTAGLLAGLGVSAIAAVLLRRFLLGLSPADPISYLIVTIVLASAALAGTAIPVRRALRVDPALTLRAE